MITPSTDQLKDLLAKVTPGEWRMGHRWQSIIADGETGHDDDDSIKAYGGHLVCESVAMPANAALIALAPSLAAEVVRLREAMQSPRITYFIRHVEGHLHELISQVIGESFGRSYETYFDNFVCSGTLAYCIEVKRRLDA